MKTWVVNLVVTLAICLIANEVPPGQRRKLITFIFFFLLIEKMFFRIDGELTAGVWLVGIFLVCFLVFEDRKLLVEYLSRLAKRLKNLLSDPIFPAMIVFLFILCVTASAVLVIMEGPNGPLPILKETKNQLDSTLSDRGAKGTVMQSHPPEPSSGKFIVQSVKQSLSEARDSIGTVASDFLTKRKQVKSGIEKQMQAEGDLQKQISATIDSVKKTGR
jgi:hypothetical protein